MEVQGFQPEIQTTMLKGTVPRSSGARISRLTQGPLMSSCKHFTLTGLQEGAIF